MPYVKKIKLISQSFTTGSRKEKIPADGTPHEVFAEITSITQTEFFSAAAAGFTPDGKATIWAFEYKGERIMVLDSQRYAIYRTYQAPGNNRMELYFMHETGPATPAPLPTPPTPEVNSNVNG